MLKQVRFRVKVILHRIRIGMEKLNLRLHEIKKAAVKPLILV